MILFLPLITSRIVIWNYCSNTTLLKEFGNISSVTKSEKEADLLLYCQNKRIDREKYKYKKKMDLKLDPFYVYSNYNLKSCQIGLNQAQASSIEFLQAISKQNIRVSYGISLENACIISSEPLPHLFEIFPRNLSKRTFFAKVFAYSNNIDSFEQVVRSEKVKKFRISFITAICVVIIPIFALRLYYLMKSLPIRMNDGFYFWFISNQGSTLTWKPILISFKLRNQIYEQVMKSNETKQDQNSIFSVSRTPKCVSFKRINVCRVDNTFSAVFIWDESFSESTEPFRQSIDGAVIKFNDSDEIIFPQVYINYEEGSFPIADINFELEGRFCSLRVDSKADDALPFDFYSLNLSYIDCIHLNLLYQSVLIKPNAENANVFLNSVYQMLDLAALCLFRANDSQFENVYFFHNSSDLPDLVATFIRTIPLSSSSAQISMKNVGKYCFASNRFNVSSIDYIVLIAYDSSKLILRENELSFHFIISMLVSFHYGVLSTKGEARALTRIYELLDRAECFALVECVGKPEMFLNSYGKLFGENVTKTEVEWMFKNIPEEMFNSIKSSENHNLHQFMVPFKHDVKGDVCISLTSSKYFDETLQDYVYFYLVEDVSTFHSQSIQLQSTYEDVKLASSFLGFHKVQRDLSLTDPFSLSLELGYKRPIKSIMDVVYDKSIDISKELEKSPKVNIRLVSALNHNVWYSIIRPSAEGCLYMFSSKEIRQINALAKRDSAKSLNVPSFDDFYLYTIDSNSGSVISLVNNTHQSVISHPNEHISDIRELVFGEDRIIFDECYSSVQKEQSKNRYSHIRMASLGPSVYFSMNIVASSPGIILIYIFNDDANFNKLKSYRESKKIADEAFQEYGIFFWAFENSSTPDRTFTSLPQHRNTLVLNWTTIANNVPLNEQEKVKETIQEAFQNKSSISMTMPFNIDEKYQFLFRGEFIDKELCGLAMNMDWIIRKYESLKKNIDDEINEIHNITHTMESDRQDLKNLIEDLKYMFSMIKKVPTSTDQDSIIDLVFRVIETFNKYLSQT